MYSAKEVTILEESNEVRSERRNSNSFSEKKVKSNYSTKPVKKKRERTGFSWLTIVCLIFSWPIIKILIGIGLIALLFVISFFGHFL